MKLHNALACLVTLVLVGGCANSSSEPSAGVSSRVDDEIGEYFRIWNQGDANLFGYRGHTVFENISTNPILILIKPAHFLDQSGFYVNGKKREGDGWHRIWIYGERSVKIHALPGSRYEVREPSWFYVGEPCGPRDGFQRVKGIGVAVKGDITSDDEGLQLTDVCRIGSRQCRDECEAYR